MVTLSRRAAKRAANIPFAPVVAIMFGIAAAAFVALVPVALFERIVMKTGLPSLLSIAGPPLGLKARILGLVVAFAAVAGLAWLVATPVARWLERDRRKRTPWADAGYVRDDAEPSAVDSRRRPIFASDELGAPLMSDEALAPPPLDLPPELEAPISVEEFVPLADADTSTAMPTATAVDIEPSVEADPVVASSTVAPVDDNSIAALIRRLEAGLAKRGLDDPDPGAPAASQADVTALPLSRDWIVGDANNRTATDSAETSSLRSALGTLRRLAAAR
jgi:hypothetical protein